MRKIKILMAFLFMLFTNVFVQATSEQDFNLVENLKQNKIRLIVMRHGEAIHNLTYMIYSDLTPGIYLTELGEQQAVNAAKAFAGLRINAFYASPQFRSLQTAQVIAKELRAPYYKIFVDPRLREQYYGVFEERTFDEFEKYFPTKEAMYTSAVPDGELGTDVFERLRLFLWKIANTHKGETVLIMTTGLNLPQINRCLTGQYGEIPELGTYLIYDYR